jgi:uncharacterized membrane protein HdeD (DUF308 family)
MLISQASGATVAVNPVLPLDTFKHPLYVETAENVLKTQNIHKVPTGMAVALFLLGLFLVLMAFLAAFVVTVVLGYILAITALAVGIYMAVKRGGRILPLVLGVVLAVFSLAVLAVVTAAQIAYPDAEIKIQHSV